MNYSLQDRRGSTVDRLKPGPTLTHPVTIHFEIQNHTTRMQKLTKAFQVYRLMVLTLICVVAGVIIGLVCRRKAKYWSERQFMYIEFPGELYLRFLRLIIIPLLVSNVILSFGTIQGKISSQLGKVAGFIYLGNNFMAIFVAILIATVICPGGKLLQSIHNDTPTNKHEHSEHKEQGSSTNNGPSLTNHHFFNEYHDSITRYREYHPMFYHSENGNFDKHDKMDRNVAVINDAGKHLVGQSTSQESKIIFDHHKHLSDQTIKPLNDLLLRHLVNKTHASRLNTIVDNENWTEKPAVNINNSKVETTHSVQSDNSITNNQSDDDDDDDEQQHRIQFIGMHNIEGNLYDNHLNRQPNLYKSDTANIYDLNTKLPIDVVLDVVRNLIPDNLIGSTLHQTRTRLFKPKDAKIDTNGSTSPSPSLWLMGHEMVNQPNVIGLLAAAVLAGVVLSHMEEASKPLLDLCSCISELSLRIGMKAISIAPPCIMFLLIGQVARARDLSSMASELLMYCVTVIVALLLHGFVLLPMVYYLITKKSPLKFFKGLMEALVASFATSSSSATMPLVLNCLADLDLNLVIVRAFGPLSCVFNMNGTAIYEAVGVIFIAQTLNVPLPFTSILLIGFCSAVASLSTSGIPSSDRFRTVVNVWSGAIVCGLIDHICPENLFEEEMKPEKYREMMKYRGSRGSLSNRKSLIVEEKPQVISVTITPPIENNLTTSV